MELLIRNGADVNIVGQDGHTAIILAAKGGENNFFFGLVQIYSKKSTFKTNKMVSISQVSRKS